MINEGVVSRIKSYLDLRFSEQREATLVDMLWYVDGLDKMIPVLDEVNEALRQHASAYVQRAGGKVTFTPIGSERTVAADDLEQAFFSYREQFAAALKKLESENLRN